MKAFVLAELSAVVLASAAAALLSKWQTPAYTAFATSAARVSDPGSNLVGRNWSGDPSAEEINERSRIE